MSPNLIVADEIWNISSEVIDGGLIPSQRAKKNPLLSMWSTAGTEKSRAMLKWREQGLKLIDDGKPGALYFAEWSPPPDIDPMQPEAWAWGNPALGHTLDAATIQAESENPDRAQFLRASVNVWVASDQSWLQPGVWSQLQYDGPLPDGGVIAIENAIDETRYFGVRAVPLPDGRTCLTVAFVTNSHAEMLQQCTALAASRSVTFAVTPSVDLHWPSHLQTRKTVVGYAEMLKWTDPVRQLIRQGMLLHTGEQMLSEHIQRAVAVRSQNSIALSTQRSPGPIELARCSVWAAALASRPRAAGKPFLVVAS
jgi:phage terminase large subunit-like protein